MGVLVSGVKACLRIVYTFTASKKNLFLPVESSLKDINNEWFIIVQGFIKVNSFHLLFWGHPERILRIFKSFLNCCVRDWNPPSKIIFEVVNGEEQKQFTKDSTVET